MLYCKKLVVGVVLCGLFEFVILDLSLSSAGNLGLQEVPTLLVSVGISESCLDVALTGPQGLSLSFLHKDMRTMW